MSPAEAGLVFAVGLFIVVLLAFRSLPEAIAAGIVGGLVVAINVYRTRAFEGDDEFGLAWSKPKTPSSESASADISEDLIDLLKSATERAERQLEASGRIEPFVVYEDRSGDTRVRRVDASDPELVLTRAREAARAVDPSAPKGHPRGRWIRPVRPPDPPGRHL